jgi:hypothetical protein
VRITTLKDIFMADSSGVWHEEKNTSRHLAPLIALVLAAIVLLLASSGLAAKRVDDIGAAPSIRGGVDLAYETGISALRRTGEDRAALEVTTTIAPKIGKHQFLLDLIQSTGENTPTGLGLNYVIAGDQVRIGDEIGGQLYVGGVVVSEWTVNEYVLSGGPAGGFLIPTGVKTGIVTNYWRTAFELRFKKGQPAIFKIREGLEVSF